MCKGRGKGKHSVFEEELQLVTFGPITKLFGGVGKVRW